MKNGYIKENRAYVYNETSSGLTTAGGGVFVYPNGSFEMQGGEISNNKAKAQVREQDTPISGDYAYGGGVCLKASGDKIPSFKMTGGTIGGTSGGNEAETAGNGIYYMGTPNAGKTGKIILGGTAVINTDNDIYLPDYITVEIASELTAVTVGNKATIPTITPASYTRTTPILTLAQNASEELAASEFPKFGVTTENPGEENERKWGLDSEGKLLLKSLVAKTRPDAFGDIIIKDGTVYGNALNVDSYSIPSTIKNNVIAVIFYAGTASDALGARIIGLGVNNSGETLKWSTTDANGYDNVAMVQEEDILYDVSNGIRDIDGRDNWAKICNIVNDEDQVATKYPAFDWVNNYATTYGLSTTNYSDGWYIPSAGELGYIFEYTAKTVQKINQVLNAIGVQTSNQLDWYKTYWSSSQGPITSWGAGQYAYAIHRTGSNLNGTKKEMTHIVLACREFSTVGPLSVSLGDTSDITVEVKSDGTVVDDDEPISGGGTITFTANLITGATYKWFVDGVIKPVPNLNILELDTSDTTEWVSGIYDVTLEVTDGTKKYSYFAQIKID